jgi:hypothetical protein
MQVVVAAMLIVVGCRGAIDPSPPAVPVRAAGLTQSMSDDQVRRLIATVGMVPISDIDYWGENASIVLGEDLRTSLTQLLRISEPQYQMLAASDDGRDLTIATFVGWQREDSLGMLRLADRHVEDKRAAIPFAGASARPGLARPAPQTVGSYIDAVLKSWFGPTVGGSHERFAMLFGQPPFDDEAARTFTQPWIARLRRARMSLDPVTERLVKERIENLAIESRAVIVALASEQDLYSPEEVRSVMLRIPDSIDQQIMGTDGDLPFDPLFRGDVGEFQRQRLANACRALKAR